MIITNIHDLPPPVVRAAIHAESSHDIGDADFSVTGLIEPPRIRVLTKKYEKMLSKDASEVGDSMRGTALDAWLGKFIEGEEMANVRLFVEVECDGKWYTISGEFDWFDPISGRLEDWKSPGVYEWTHPKAEREIQLNIYAYLLAKHGYTVNRIGNTFLFKDYSPSTAEYKGEDYPPASISSADVDRVRRWSNTEVEEYIRGRIRLHRDSTEETLCTDEDRWLENKWAVMNEHGTRAMNNATFDSQGAAEAFCGTQDIPYDRIEFRAGEPRRCKHWCGVAEFCLQYKGDQ